MNETRIYADAFETTFANTKEMLEFLAERAKASRWIRKPTRMLRLVPLSYVLWAGVIGTVVAVVLGVTVVKLLVENGPIWYMTFHLTILPAILLSLIYTVLALIIPMVSLRFLNRQSIVERLRTGE